MRLNSRRCIMLLAVMIAICECLSARSFLPPGTALAKASKRQSRRLLSINHWSIYTTNYGQFISMQGGGTWMGPSYRYVFGAGLWVGADRLMAQVSCGFDPNTAQGSFGPVNPFTGAWSNWNDDPQVRAYLSTDSADLAEWPLTVSDGMPLVRSEQDCYAVYSDENPEFTPNGQQPIGVMVRQWSYAWNNADNTDIVFFCFRVINVSEFDLDNVYIGPYIDSDIGNFSSNYCEFDYDRSLALQYTTDLPYYGWKRAGIFGCRLLETPRNTTGQTVHIIDNAYSHDIGPGQALGMTAFQIYGNAYSPPKTTYERYISMQGINYQTMQSDAYSDSGAIVPEDKKFLMVSGPVFLAREDSADISIAVMCAWDTTAVRKLSDNAQEIYDNGFEVAAPPLLPEITLLPEDKRVRITWTRRSETKPDPYWAKIDPVPRWYDYFKGTYRTMYQGRWKYHVDTTKIDSFRIRTGSSTILAIARGTANPPGGTDTTEAFYSQQEMYEPYDFQCYTIYRALSRPDLDNPARREMLGGINRNPVTGVSSCAFDKNDGIQVVLDIGSNTYATTDSDYTMPKYDTLGTDRGLVYELVDSNVVNNFGHWYGIAAADYQPNVYFTRKCPTTLATKPSQSAAFAAAQPSCSDYLPGTVRYTVTRGMDDVRSPDGYGTVDYANKLSVSNANKVRNANYYLLWSVNKEGDGNGVARRPFYKAVIYGAPGTQFQGFTGVPATGWPAPAGWVFAGITTDTGYFGAASPSIRFDNTGDTAVTPRFRNPTGLSYWIKGLGTDANSALLVQGYNGNSWTTLDSVRPLDTVGATRQIAITSPVSQVRFVYSKSAGNLVLDDVAIQGQFIVDSTGVSTAYGRSIATDPASSFYGTSYDELAFGGIIFQPKVVFKPWLARIDSDSLQITEIPGGARTYPRDSCCTVLDLNTWTATVAMWMWRGADFEIHWKDTMVRIGSATQDSACLTCTVWDVTNGLQVPWVGTGTKASMTVQGWTFSPAAQNGNLPYIYNRNSVDNIGMFISGVTLYFNRRNSSSPIFNRMLWSQRPESGDIWRINCAGPRTPVDSNAITITTTAPELTSSPSLRLLDRVQVVPNPFLVRAGWDMSLDHPNLYFTNLPARCTIRIYNMAGDLITVLNHGKTNSANSSSERWNLLTPYSKRVASGIYIYHLDAPGIGTKTGKFAVIR